MWTREVPKQDGYYWARWIDRHKEVYSPEIVRLQSNGSVRYVATMQDDDCQWPDMFLWYDEPLYFVPPPFTSDDAVRLGVTGE